MGSLSRAKALRMGRNGRWSGFSIPPLPITTNSLKPTSARLCAALPHPQGGIVLCERITRSPKTGTHREPTGQKRPNALTFERCKLLNLQEIFGAPGRVRTRDPLITNQVLYQLSYKGMAWQIADSVLV